MIPKQKLIRRLENIAELEDEGVKLITRSLIKLLNRSDLEEEHRQRILEIAEIIRRESEGHKKAIVGVVNRLKMEAKDEF
ncbi:MAG: hypothetical protein GXO66_09770 [Euryarchaeota archaeon]|nr:hypothetical protein [Euryarchaeota archaeon]